MLDLKFLSRKSGNEIRKPAQTEEAAQRRAESVETDITTTRRWLLGRRISFCIDDSSIQMAAVLHLGNRVKLLDLNKEYFPSDLTDADKIRNYCSESIIRYVRQYGGRKPIVTLAVSGRETAYRTFVMPLLNKSDLEAAVGFEVKKQIPFPTENCVYDYRSNSRLESPESKRLKIGLFAATRQLITNQLNPFQDQGITVSQIHQSQDLIGRLLRYLPDFTDDTGYTLIDIGRSRSEISFFRGQTLEFYHISSVGSSLMGRQPAQTQYEYFAETLLAEIQTSLDYYSGQFPPNANNQIYVYGDMAYSDDLFELLTTSTGFDLKRFPIRKLNLPVDLDERFLDFVPPCLPVLAAGICRDRLANLLPPEEKRRLTIRKVDNSGRLALAALVAMVAISLWTTAMQVSQERDTVATLNRQIEQFQQSDAFHTYNVIKRQVGLNKEYLDKIKESPSYMHLSLKELSLLTPPDVRIFELQFDPAAEADNLTLRGVVISKEVPPEIVLAEYVQNLIGSPFYDAVKVIRHVKKQVKGHFEIEFQLGIRGIT